MRASMHEEDAMDSALSEYGGSPEGDKEHESDEVSMVMSKIRRYLDDLESLLG